MSHSAPLRWGAALGTASLLTIAGCDSPSGAHFDTPHQPFISQRSTSDLFTSRDGVPGMPGAPSSANGAETSRAVAELVSASDRIAVGRIRAVDVFSTGPAGRQGIHSRVSLSVYRTVRGPLSRTLEFWLKGGELDQRRRSVVGQAAYLLGEEVAIFLHRAPDGSLWPARSAKWELIRDVEGWLLTVPEATALNDAVHRGAAFPSIQFSELIQIARSNLVEVRTR